jgi:hypothetical protein
VAHTYGDSAFFLSFIVTHKRTHHRSIHNTRIERLWYDVTSGFGHKWKIFFLGLEHNDGLDPSTPAHIWLLHFLFMANIHDDAQRWAAAWNLHKMQIDGQRSRSPTDMFAFGMYQSGARGLDLRPEPDLAEAVPNVGEYGVDWDVHRSRRLMQHLRTNNPDADQAAQSFQLPTHMARVDCEPPNCPFTPIQMDRLRRELSLRASASLYQHDMPSRRLVWQYAFDIASEVHADGIV